MPDLSPLLQSESRPHYRYARWPFLKDDLFYTPLRLLSAIIILYFSKLCCPHSLHHCLLLSLLISLPPLKHTPTLSDATFGSLAGPAPLSGQKRKDYRGMGVPSSLEIGQVLRARSCLSLSRGGGGYACIQTESDFMLVPAHVHNNALCVTVHLHVSGSVQCVWFHAVRFLFPGVGGT